MASKSCHACRYNSVRLVLTQPTTYAAAPSVVVGKAEVARPVQNTEIQPRTDSPWSFKSVAAETPSRKKNTRKGLSYVKDQDEFVG